MSSIQALREQRNVIAVAMAALNHADRAWNPAVDQPVWDAHMTNLEAIEGQIRRSETITALTAEQFAIDTISHEAQRLARDKPKQSKQALLFNKWLRGGDKVMTAEDWTDVRNTLSTTTPAEGGYTVESDIASTLIDALKAYGGMREVAEIFKMAQGNPLSFPTSDGTAEVGELIAQNTTATAADPTFGTVDLPVYKFSSKVIAVPFELLQDSSIDIEAFVRARIATRLGRITNTFFTTGTGSAQPRGVIVGATVGITAANGTTQVTAITYDSLVDLVHSVDPAYRKGKCKFMMNDGSVKNVRKIKDGQSRPIFNPGYELNVPGGAPDMLLGYQIQINQDVAVMAASAKSIAFGDFSYYKIRDVMAAELFRFTDSAYTKLGQVGFLAWMRSGGNLVDTGAVKTFVNAAS